MFLHSFTCQGCDGSVLLEDSVADGIDSEQNAPGNLGIQGQNIVADIKTAVENACPNVVSCADILAIASNSAVVLVKTLSVTFLIYGEFKIDTLVLKK